MKKISFRGVLLALSFFSLPGLPAAQAAASAWTNADPTTLPAGTQFRLLRDVVVRSGQYAPAYFPAVLPSTSPAADGTYYAANQALICDFFANDSRSPVGRILPTNTVLRLQSVFTIAEGVESEGARAGFLFADVDGFSNIEMHCNSLSVARIAPDGAITFDDLVGLSVSQLACVFELNVAGANETVSTCGLDGRVSVAAAPVTGGASTIDIGGVMNDTWSDEIDRRAAEVGTFCAHHGTWKSCQ